MNREILFRGKRKDNGEWIEGYFFKAEQHCFIIQTQSKGKYLKKEHYANIERCYEVIPETVGQYTGLTDKNGNKIFEGDIVKVINYDDIDIEVVKWSKNGAGFFAEINDCYEEFDRFVAKLCEVIGNIYDNADLLRENNEVKENADNEIIKALEYCKRSVGAIICTSNCPMYNECESEYPQEDICRLALDIINRQKAEIERLKQESETLVTQIKNVYEQIVELNKLLNVSKSEAIKEFAERLKKDILPAVVNDRIEYIKAEYDIDKLVKEMTEEIQ